MHFHWKSLTLSQLIAVNDLFQEIHIFVSKTQKYLKLLHKNSESDMPLCQRPYCPLSPVIYTVYIEMLQLYGKPNSLNLQWINMSNWTEWCLFDVCAHVFIWGLYMRAVHTAKQIHFHTVSLYVLFSCWFNTYSICQQVITFIFIIVVHQAILQNASSNPLSKCF